MICGSSKQAQDKFVNARDEEYYRFLKTQYWQSNDANWIYFVYINPVIVATAYFFFLMKTVYYSVFFIDIIFIYFVRIFNKPLDS
jgi:hypothetical protein